MNNLISYIKSSFDEVVNKVSWPTFAELQKSTLLVIVASLIFAAVVLLIDQAFKGVLENVY